MPEDMWPPADAPLDAYLAGRRIVFACDLDGTLLHSARIREPGDILVERIRGEERTFLAPRAARLLQELSAYALFIPFTSRTISQYRRIQWPDGLCPSAAVTSNGGALLLDDKKNIPWERFWLQATGIGRVHLDVALEEISGFPNLVSAHVADDMFGAAMFEDVQSASEAQLVLKKKLDRRSKLTATVVGRKLYVLPSPLSKGKALAVLNKGFSLAPTVISAGDSILDAGLHAHGALALMPDTYSWTDLDLTVKKAPAGHDFAETILRCAVDWCRQQPGAAEHEEGDGTKDISRQ